MFSIGLSHSLTLTHTHIYIVARVLSPFVVLRVPAYFIYKTYAIVYTNILANIIVKFCLLYYEIQILFNIQQSLSKEGEITVIWFPYIVVWHVF